MPQDHVPLSAAQHGQPPTLARIHPKIVQELLGHSQITLTLDTYSHVLPSLQGEALDRLGALLTTAEGPVAVTVAVKAVEVQGA